MKTPALHGRLLLLVAMLLIAPAVSGVFAAEAGAKPLVFAFVASALLFATAVWGGAVPISLTVLGSAGALPFIDPRRGVAAGATVQDIWIAALTMTLVCLAFLDNSRGQRRLASRGLDAVCLSIVALWAGNLGRTVFEGTPAGSAVLMGRDFVIVALLLPLLTRVLSLPSRRNRSVAIIGVWMSVYGLAISAASLGAGGVVGTILISNHEFTQEGLLRVYPYAPDLLAATFLFALASWAWSSASVPAVRLAATFVTASTGLGLILLQTRAYYLGIVIAAAIVIAATPTRLRSLGRTMKLMLAFAVVSAAVLAIAPREISERVGNGIGSRLASIATDSQTSSASESTVAYRRDVTAAMRHRLEREDAWALGLGFLSASTKYDPTLPGGSIRNPDVGVYNVLLTSGIVGAIVYLGALALAVPALLLKRFSDRESGWLAVGAVSYLGLGFATALTLGAFTSLSGAVATSLAVAFGLSLQSAAPQRKVLSNDLADARAGRDQHDVVSERSASS